ncbi:hypothetical protein N7536_007680 [Penicillium majusculum]|nr:hypothetical protein N7536_007680 [Penicillium majusculum]
MSKEVFLFSDDLGAIRRIRGDMAYDPNDEIGAQMAAMSGHSQALHNLGVHIELHLSPGHSGVLGNVAADKMAKKAMYDLFEKTTTAWPTLMHTPTEPVWRPASRGTRRGRGLPSPALPLLCSYHRLNQAHTVRHG